MRGKYCSSLLYIFFSTEAHILEDVNKCVQALQDKDPETVDRTAGQIRGRTARLEDVVTAEMENYQQGPYTDNVFRAVLIMHNEGIDDFLINNAISLNHLEQAKRFVPKTFTFLDTNHPQFFQMQACICYYGINDSVMLRFVFSMSP